MGNDKVSIDAVWFSVLDKTKAEKEAREDAFLKVRAKATQYAALSGGRVSHVTSLSEYGESRVGEKGNRRHCTGRKSSHASSPIYDPPCCLSRQPHCLHQKSERRRERDRMRSKDGEESSQIPIILTDL